MPMDWRPRPVDCARLLRQAFPGLRADSVNVLGEGWDNVAFLVNGALIVRLPKRPDGDRMLRRERALLAVIAERLPVPVPRCTHLAEHLPGFPSGVGAYPLIKGTPLDEAHTLVRNGGDLAPAVASFLRALHGIDAGSLPVGLLEPPAPATWWQERQELVQTALPVIEPQLPAGSVQAIRQRWEAAFARAQEAGFVPVLIHGDLAPEHILVNARGGLAGVIDFGDAVLGDPALDFAGFSDMFAERVLRLYEADESARRNLDVRRGFYRLTAPFHAIRAGLTWQRDDLIDEGLLGVTQRFDLDQQDIRH